MVTGPSGSPEQRPGYLSEQDVPGGHAEHGSPFLYISDLCNRLYYKAFNL